MIMTKKMMEIMKLMMMIGKMMINKKLEDNDDFFVKYNEFKNYFLLF